MNTAGSHIEARIKKIWEAILKLSIEDSNSDFFQLGGDSVSMIDMLMTLGEEFGTEINPGLLFDDSTLSGFTRVVERHINSDST